MASDAIAINNSVLYKLTISVFFNLGSFSRSTHILMANVREMRKVANITTYIKITVSTTCVLSIGLFIYDFVT